MTHSFEIESAMLRAVPKISVFFGVVRKIDVSKIERDGIEKFLADSWKLAREEISKYPNVQSHPNIQLWRQAFQALKISTKKYSTSVESMAKRAAKEDSKPFSINPLVDFYNAFSLKFLLPFGGFDMHNDVSKTLSLRFSKEGDKFLALDADTAIDIPPGEAVYASGSTVVTRYINWKQSKEGLIEATTTDVCFMAEVLNGYPEAQLEDMQNEFKARCLEFLHAEVEIYILNESNPSITY